MKTAEEWQASLRCMSSSEIACVVTLKAIRAIQADALRHAVEFIDDANGFDLMRKTISELEGSSHDNP